MNEIEDQRGNWRTNWLSSIQEFADAETQGRMWLDPPNPHYSYGEYLCCYFDDLRLSDGGYEWALNEGLVTADEMAAVIGLHAAADAYDPKDIWDHKSIRADPKWADVVAAAMRAQTALLDLSADPRSRVASRRSRSEKR